MKRKPGVYARDCKFASGLATRMSRKILLRWRKGGQCCTEGHVRAIVALCWVLMSVLPASAVTPLALESKASQLYSAAHDLMGKTHYLEALDLLHDARAILVAADMDAGKQFADILFAMAEAKTKGRLYQQFPAAMVKSALKEVQAATRLWERLHGIPAQKLSQGYYLEGYIHKRFFMRSREAVACFKKAVTVDPGNAAAKRELSELIVSAEGD